MFKIVKQFGNKENWDIYYSNHDDLLRILITKLSAMIKGIR